jgi:hypothetical protein
VTHSLLPALRRQGYTVSTQDVRYVFNAELVADAGRESAEIASAELRMRQDGVTHVIFLEKGGLPVLFFLNTAASQGYHPRYGFTSQDAPEALLSGNEIQASQLKGALGIGWLPVIDLPFPPKGAYARSAPVRKCRAVMTRAGQAPTSPDAMGIALGACDEVWFLRAAARGLSGSLTVGRLLHGIQSLGTGFTSALTIATAFGAGQRDGAAAAYRYAFSPGCSCWQYVGKPVRVS